MRGNRPTRVIDLRWSEVRALLAFVPDHNGRGLVLQLSVFEDRDIILAAMIADVSEMEGKRPEDVMRDAAAGLQQIYQGPSLRAAQDKAKDAAAAFLAGNKISDL